MAILSRVSHIWIRADSTLQAAEFSTPSTTMTSLSEELDPSELHNGERGRSEEAEEFVMVNGPAHEQLRGLEQRILEQKEVCGSTFIIVPLLIIPLAVPRRLSSCTPNCRRKTT